MNNEGGALKAVLDTMNVQFKELDASI